MFIKHTPTKMMQDIVNTKAANLIQFHVSSCTQMPQELNQLLENVRFGTEFQILQIHSIH